MFQLDIERLINQNCNTLAPPDDRGFRNCSDNFLPFLLGLKEGYHSPIPFNDREFVYLIPIPD